jgi:hypothetical protein
VETPKIPDRQGQRSAEEVNCGAKETPFAVLNPIFAPERVAVPPIANQVRFLRGQGRFPTFSLPLGRCCSVGKIAGGAVGES